MEIIFSTGQLAKLLGVRPYQIEYAHASGKLPEPAFRFLGKRVYDAGDARRVATFFRVNLITGAPKEDA